jgi:hypothetical protein
MITLTTICILYSIFGLMKFKKLYGHYTVFDEDMKAWTLLLAMSILYSGVMGIALIVKYLP